MARAGASAVARRAASVERILVMIVLVRCSGWVSCIEGARCLLLGAEVDGCGTVLVVSGLLLHHGG